MTAQITKIKAIIAKFEGGDYGLVETYADGKDGRRQVTYGLYQTTEDSGGLKVLIAMYIAAKGKYALQLRKPEYYNNIGTGVLHASEKFKKLLKAAAADPIMRQTQDEFFDSQYFARAEKWAVEYGFTLPLSKLVIYDSFIHSGGILDFLRRRFPEVPPSRGGDEKKWIRAYLKQRRLWLENHDNRILRKTVYRVDAMIFSEWTEDWQLAKDFVIPFESGDFIVK